MTKLKINTTNLVDYIPCFALIVLVAVVTTFVLTGNLNFAKKGTLTIGIPIILASLFAIFKPKALFERNLCEYSDINIGKYTTYLLLFFIQIYIISGIILITDSKRPVIYFLLIALLGSIILIETIFLKSRQIYIKIIILSQILLVLLNLCAGVVFKYPLYFGNTDILLHMYFIRTILTTSHVTYLMGDYQYFPLFHVLNSVFILTTEMNNLTAYFILGILLSSFYVLLTYLIALIVTRNIKMSIIAALLFLFSRPILFASTYVISSTACYVFCILVLYLLMIEKQNIKLVTLSIFLIISMVLMHQLTLVVFLCLLILLLLIELVFQYNKLLSYKYMILFFGSFLSYWVYLCGPFVSKILTTIFATSDPISINAELEILPIWTVLIRNIDITLITLITLIAAYAMVRQMNNKLIQVFGLTAIILLPLYFQDIANLFTSFVGYRFPIYVSPFIAIASSIGIYSVLMKCLSDHAHQKIIQIILSILVMSYFFSSPILLAKSIDFDEFPNILGENGRLYFTQGELDSFSFYEKHGDLQSALFGDYNVFRYINGFLAQPCSCSIDVFNVDRLSYSSYFIFREGEYISAERLDFFTDRTVSRGFRNWITKTWRLSRDPYPAKIWSKQESLYNNGQVKLYYKIV